MKDPKKTPKNIANGLKKLKDENTQLKQTLHSIQTGAVDAFIIKNKNGTESIFTLEGEEKPYRILIESLSLGAVTLTKEGKIIHCNKQFSKMINRPIKIITGSFLYEYIPKMEHEKIKTLLNQPNIHHLKENVTITGKNTIQKTIQLTCNNIKFGNVEGISVIATDITERSNELNKLVTAQENLIKNEVLFRQIAENINDVFWRMSPDMDKITYISPGYDLIWGRSRESLYLNPFEWMDAIVDSDKHNVEQFLHKLQSQEFASVEYSIHQPNGSLSSECCA